MNYAELGLRNTIKLIESTKNDFQEKNWLSIDL